MVAVVKEALGSRLAIVLQTGTDALGQPVFRTRSYSGVKSSALDADVFAVGVAIGALQQHPVDSVQRVDESKLVDQV